MQILFWLLAFAVAISIHEAAHAWMADRLGDPTARLNGRMTLNPIVHADLYGTVLIPLFLMFIGSPFVFGWAKPVPIDPFNLKDPRRDSAIISFAGPLANILLAVLLSLILRTILSPFSPAVYFSQLIFALIQFNIVIAVFNLIPVHPLDGGKILVGLLSNETGRKVDLILNQYGTILLLMLIFPLFG
ncbi:MAG: site-2 protease family protein, partial [bacterium]|nr:site-2 protease family protein [bacterium]